MIYSADYNKYKKKYLVTDSQLIFSSQFLYQYGDSPYGISILDALKEFPLCIYEKDILINKCVKHIFDLKKSDTTLSKALFNLSDAYDSTIDDHGSPQGRVTSKMKNLQKLFFEKEIQLIESRVNKYKKEYSDSERLRNRWRVCFLYHMARSHVSREYKNGYFNKQEEEWRQLLTKAEGGKRTKLIFTQDEFEKLWDFCNEYKEKNPDETESLNHFLFFKLCPDRQHRSLLSTIKRYGYILFFDEALKLLKENKIDLESASCKKLFFKDSDAAIISIKKRLKKSRKGKIPDIDGIANRCIIYGEQGLTEKKFKKKLKSRLD